MTDPKAARLPRPNLSTPGVHLQPTPISNNQRVTVGGRPGTIVTFRHSARGMRYGVALDSGALLPDVGEDVLDRPVALVADAGGL